MADNKANKEQVHRVFQNISKKYDRLNNIISFEQSIKYGENAS